MVQMLSPYWDLTSTSYLIKDPEKGSQKRVPAKDSSQRPLLGVPAILFFLAGSLCTLGLIMKETIPL